MTSDINREKILVTSALPYANGPIHLGHIAGAYLPADIFVRYHRLKGDDVIYICGSDEHGVPISLKAESEGVTPQEIVDRYHQMNKNSFERLGISFDNYSRTSLPLHHEVSQDFFRRLYDMGMFTVKTETQLYCPHDEMYLPDRYVEGKCPNCGFPDARGDQCDSCGTWLETIKLVEPRCKICGATPRPEKTQHWYIPLGKYQDEIEKWMDSKNGWKQNVLNYCKGWFRNGLEDRAVTRDLNWGVQVPLQEAEGKVLYVWFDAPIGYISSTIEWAENKGDRSLWEDYWKNPDTKIYHFIGKDNIIFHAILFPLMLMKYGEYTLQENVVANEFLNLEGSKISTSKNFAVWLDDYLNSFPPDSLRYCLASISPESRDADFTWKDFQARNNNELADILGNFINRSLVFIRNNFDARVPEPGILNGEDEELIRQSESRLSKVAHYLETFQVKAGIGELMDIARLANKYFNDAEPWISVKNDRERCAATLYTCVQLIKNLTVGMMPFLPFSADKIIDTMDIREMFDNGKWDDLITTNVISGTEIKRPRILFKKIEDKVIEKEIEKLQLVLEDKNEPQEEKGVKTEENIVEQITIEDFKKLDLRVAEIKSAAPVPKTDKLLRLEVDDGEEIRFIVSGIADQYTPEDLVGKSIILLANLKPAKIRGEISNGMLLAASEGEKLALLQPDKDMKPGSTIS